MGIEIITQKLILDLIMEAQNSPRLRTMRCLHKPEDRLQRMINVGLKDTYVRPHRHKNPPKIEGFTILNGDVALIEFYDNGKIKNVVELSRNNIKENKIAWISPETWHGFAVLSPYAAMSEVVDGHYDAKTHKEFAPWSPSEDSQEAKQYFINLKSEVKQYLESKD